MVYGKKPYDLERSLNPLYLAYLKKSVAMTQFLSLAYMQVLLFVMLIHRSDLISFSKFPYTISRKVKLGKLITKPLTFASIFHPLT